MHLSRFIEHLWCICWISCIFCFIFFYLFFVRFIHSHTFTANQNSFIATNKKLLKMCAIKSNTWKCGQCWNSCENRRFIRFAKCELNVSVSANYSYTVNKIKGIRVRSRAACIFNGICRRELKRISDLIEVLIEFCVCVDTACAGESTFGAFDCGTTTSTTDVWRTILVCETVNWCVFRSWKGSASCSNFGFGSTWKATWATIDVEGVLHCWFICTALHNSQFSWQFFFR